MPKDVYELFRLTLIKRRHNDLFEQFEPARQDYINESLSKRIDFEHHAKPFSYIPLPSAASSHIIIGKIGRSIHVPENASPDEHFDEQVRESWKASVIAIDPGSGVDGQKVSMQKDKRVGKTFSVLRSLVKEINRDQNAAYTFEVQPIFDSKTFWEFASENRGNITSLTFDFVVPNGIWNIDSNVKDDLRSIGELMNAEEVITTVKSEQGINTDSGPVEEVLDYMKG